MKINYSNLKAGDVVVCGADTIVGSIIRFFTRRDTGKYKVSTHTAIVVDFWGQKLIAEMWASGLRISSLEKYNSGNKNYIISIKRAKDLTDENRVKLQKEISKDLRKRLAYDWLGDLSFIFKNIKEDKNKFFCSEYVFYLLKNSGVETNYIEKVAPSNFQDKSAILNLEDVEWVI